MQEVLNIQNLSFSYTKEKSIFQNFSLRLFKGEIKAIVGESGAGKSTLFDLITGELKAENGSIKVAKISEVFQDPYSSFHHSHTIISQIKDVASLENINSIAMSIGLEEEFLHKYSFELSGGQLQRASIIRAILMQPDLILLDEPTSALDNIIQLDVMKSILSHLENFGVLLITHDMDLAKWCANEIISI